MEGKANIMSNKPKVSVITSVYNCERYLAEAVESVLAQTVTDFEYIIVDDGSTDKTPEIIEDFILRDSRIKTVRIENSGPANARNVALQRAKGNWIAILDADDVCLPHRLEYQVKFVKDHPGCILVGGRCVEITADGTIVKEHYYHCDHDKLLNNLERGANFFPHSSNFYRRMLGSTAMRYNPRFVQSEDADLWLRIAETGHIASLNIPLIKLRKHSQMISNTNHGRLQTVMGMSARICHFRRMAHLSDPSQMEENVWQEFLKWVENRLEEDGYFKRMNEWKKLRADWYLNNKGTAKAGKYKLLIRNVLNLPAVAMLIFLRFYKGNFALKLANESKKYFV